MVNDNGRCYPFDNRGAGYGRAEGVAVMVLKRLNDALRDGDSVRAIIRASGVGQDGKTNGILLPSSQAQQELVASLYNKSGIDPQQVAYVEAHGTGTQAGDAAEINSIKAVFLGDQSTRETPLPDWLNKGQSWTFRERQWVGRNSKGDAFVRKIFDSTSGPAGASKKGKR